MTTREFVKPGWPEWAEALTAAVGVLACAGPVAGGDINEAWQVQLVDGRRMFVKSHASPPPGLYPAEADGLAWLAEGPLRVPGVIAVGASFLALEWLDLGARGASGGRAAGAFDERLGRGLAQLHRLGAPGLGYRRDNYLGTLRQDNAPAPDLPAFWVERRLRPVIERLGDRALLARLDQLATHPERFGPPEPVARLHGDLWWGNVGNLHGEPVVFDPAVYGGHREIDLAMLALFGGLGDRLIAAYDEVWPIADGWRGRLGLWQLYPLACHAVLFGGGYLPQLARSLDAVAA
jgi:fructosamine-3-kinase